MRLPRPPTLQPAALSLALMPLPARVARLGGHRLPPRTARYAAFFNWEDAARAELAGCLATGAVEASQCCLLSAHSPRGTRSLPAQAHSRGVDRALVMGLAVGALAGALLGGVVGGLWEGLALSLTGEPGSLVAQVGELGWMVWSGVGAVAGAAWGGWRARHSAQALSARRFDRTVQRRLRMGDTVVVIHHLAEWQLAPLSARLERHCQRWCSDVGVQVRI